MDLKHLFFCFVTIAALLLAVKAQTSSRQLPKEIPLSQQSSDIFVEGKTVVTEIIFTGLDADNRPYGEFIDYPIYEVDFRKELAYKKLQYGPAEPYKLEKVGKVLAELKEVLSYKGYLKAEVKAIGVKIDKNQMAIRFTVERGPQMRVTEVNFIGNINISSEEFVVDFKNCSGDNWERYD